MFLYVTISFPYIYDDTIVKARYSIKGQFRLVIKATIVPRVRLNSIIFRFLRMALFSLSLILSECISSNTPTTLILVKWYWKGRQAEFLVISLFIFALTGKASRTSINLPILEALLLLRVALHLMSPVALTALDPFSLSYSKSGLEDTSMSTSSCQANVLFVLLYGSRTWEVTFIATSLHYHLSLPCHRWLDTTWNEELRRDKDQLPIDVLIRRWKWQCVGCILRKSTTIS